MTPCVGWLNSNQTFRDRASNHALMLNKMYQEIVEEYEFENFDIAYYDFPANEII